MRSLSLFTGREQTDFPRRGSWLRVGSPFDSQG